jgi:tetratricopeptide (TPR) repeat protein
LADAYPARPVFRCALAHLYSRLGRRELAQQAFAAVRNDGFSAVPFDQEWLYAVSLLADTCAFLRDVDAAEELYPLLLPYAGLAAVDVGEGFAGSASRYLGLLASTTSRWDDAARHFEDALAMNERMGARPWLAHTQHDFARMLIARDAPGDREHAHDLLAAAAATYRELRMDTYAARAKQTAAPGSESPRPR